MALSVPFCMLDLVLTSAGGNVRSVVALLDLITWCLDPSQSSFGEVHCSRDRAIWHSHEVAR